jgi:hypothetical protein
MCNKNTNIKRYEMIETIIPAGAAGSVPFPDVPNLRNQTDQRIIVLDLEFFPAYVYGASFLNTTVPGTPVAEIPKIAIVLYVNGEESIRRIPIGKINYSQDPAFTAPFQMERVSFDNLENVDWPKSYFQFNAALAGNPYIIPIGVTYLKFKQQNL